MWHLAGKRTKLKAGDVIRASRSSSLIQVMRGPEYLTWHLPGEAAANGFTTMCSDLTGLRVIAAFAAGSVGLILSGMSSTGASAAWELVEPPQ